MLGLLPFAARKQNDRRMTKGGSTRKAARKGAVLENGSESSRHGATNGSSNGDHYDTEDGTEGDGLDEHDGMNGNGHNHNGLPEEVELQKV